MEDEIDLGQILIVLWKRRFLIILLTGICFLISLIVFMLLPDLYQTNSTIMITPSSLQFLKNPLDATLSLEGKGKSASIPRISLETHRNLLKSQAIMGKIKENIGEDSLEAKLEVESVKNTSLLNLKVKGRDPLRVQKIANVWVKEYLELSRKLLSEATYSSTKFLLDEYKIRRKKLEEVEGKIGIINKENRLENLEIKLSLLKKKLILYEDTLINQEDKLKISRQKLENLKKEISKHSRFIAVSKAIGDDALWKEIRNNEAAWKNIQKKKLITQVLNKVYQKLEIDIAETEVTVGSLADELKYVKSKYSSTKNTVFSLQDKVSNLRGRINKLKRDKALANEMFQSVFSRITEAELASRVDVGDVKIVSFAVLPTSPVSFQKSKTVTIVSLLGFITGIFAAFLLEFIEKQRIKA